MNAIRIYLIVAIILGVQGCSSETTSSTPQTLHRKKSKLPRFERPAPPADVLPYEIYKREERPLPFGKLIVSVRVDFIDGGRLPNESQLKAITRQIGYDNPAFDRVFCAFYIRCHDNDLHPTFFANTAELPNPDDDYCNITYRPIPKSKERERFGFSESKRKQIYFDLSEMDRAGYSLPIDKSPGAESERTQLQRHQLQVERQREAYFRRLGCENLYWEICKEGMSKGWPEPESYGD